MINQAISSGFSRSYEQQDARRLFYIAVVYISRYTYYIHFVVMCSTVILLIEYTQQKCIVYLQVMNNVSYQRITRSKTSSLKHHIMILCLC